MEFVQYIIINNELKMSPAKLAVQVAHASQGFIKEYFLTDDATLEARMIDNWYGKDYKKIVLKLSGEAAMEKFIKKAIDFGYEEDKDFFRVYDLGYTELEPNTFTAIGFIPTDKDEIHDLVKRLRLL